MQEDFRVSSHEYHVDEQGPEDQSDLMQLFSGDHLDLGVPRDGGIRPSGTVNPPDRLTDQEPPAGHLTSPRIDRIALTLSCHRNGGEIRADICTRTE